MKKEYTPEETAKYIAERNANLKAERAARRPQLIWDSKAQGTFKGSVYDELIDIKTEVDETTTTTEA